MSEGNHKVALITGGAVRVGAALSLGFAEAGYHVAVNYHKSDGEARALARRIGKLGRRVALLQGSVASEDDAQRMIDEAERELGRLDVLVNSASVFREAQLLSIDATEWDEVMAVNLRGPFLMAKFAERLLRVSRGSIINIVDVSALRPWARYPHHSVSKAALLHLTKVMAKAFAPHVRVNAIAPGTVLPPEGSPPQELERERRKTLLDRLGSPDDVVQAALFLAGASYVTGDVILVDGGLALGS
ncbi:MAG: SDR family oxidoreductase [Gemmatimonadota bacterium]